MERIKVELKDHVGHGRSGTIIDHGQYIVMADGVHVGYLPKRPGSWLACIVAMDDDVRANIQEQVNEMIDAPIGGVAMPPEPVEEEDESE